MGQQKHRKQLYINAELKKLPKLIKTENGQDLTTYEKSSKNKTSKISRRGIAKIPRPALKRPTLLLSLPKLSKKPPKVVRSLPVSSDFHHKKIPPAEPKKISRVKSHSLPQRPKTASLHKKSVKKIEVKQEQSTPKSKKKPVSNQSSLGSQSLPSTTKKKQSVDNNLKTISKKLLEVENEASESFTKSALKKNSDSKRTLPNDRLRTGFKDLWKFSAPVAVPSLSRFPELRSILKKSSGAMNYSQVKKIDEDSLQRLTEGKGPVDECMCAMLSPPQYSKGKSIKASLKRAFASISGQGGKRKGEPGFVQNSVEIPLTYTRGDKGGIYTTKEVVKRKSPCGKCGCDKGPVVLKHSLANIRITSPDISTICPCPKDCLSDKDKFSSKIKVTVERLALDVDTIDSEFSLRREPHQPDAISEPDLKEEELNEMSEDSEWSSGNNSLSTMK